MRAAFLFPVLAASAVFGGTASGGEECLRDIRRRAVFEYCQDVRWSFDRDGRPTTNDVPVPVKASSGETDISGQELAAFDRHGGFEAVAAPFLRWMDAENSVPGEIAFMAGWDDGGIFVLSENGSEIRCLKRYDILKGTAECLTPTNGARDLVGPLPLHATADAELRVAGLSWRTENGVSNEWFDAHMAAAEKMLVDAFPGCVPYWVAESPAEPFRRIAECRFADAPPVWADVDAEGGTVRVLSRFPEPLDPMVRRVFRWRSSDGEELCGIVSFPGKGGPFPLAVFPHGGPGLLSDETFDERVWALVDAGFAVLQPNYRGSTGFGKRFRFAGLGPDGFRRALDDIHEAAVAAQGDGTLPVAKGGPVLLGGSWGGWCVIELLSRHPDFYAGGVSFFGAFDLPELVRSETARIAGSGLTGADRELQALFRQFGDPSDAEAMAKLSELSPASHAAAVAAPVVLFHNRDDAIIPFAQSEAMFAALKDAGVRAEFRAGAGGHGFPAADEARIYGELASLFRSWTGRITTAEEGRPGRPARP